MPFHDLRPRLDAGDSEPLALQLVQLLASEIRDGRIVPGEALPALPGRPMEPAFEMPSQLTPVSSLMAGMVDLSEAWPDPRLAPKDALAKAKGFLPRGAGGLGVA